MADAADVAGTVRRGDGAAALAFAVGNWVGDLACLIAVGYAFGLTLSVVQLAGAYLAVQIVRQIPITPGGIGLIEASLLVALVAAGAPHIAAAAVVLVYRVLSCWLIVPTGFLAWVVLQSTGRRADHDRLLRRNVTREDSQRRVADLDLRADRYSGHGVRRVGPVDRVLSAR
jgi:uncharacterized membrane protein YbhN (UPF0104 family)